MSPPSATPSLVRAAIERSLLEAKPIRDVEVQAAAKRALDYRKIKYQVEDLTKTYAPLHSEKTNWPARPKHCYNLLQRVTKASCTLYQDPVKRTWEDKDKAWGEKMAGLRRLKPTLQATDEKTFLSSCVLVRPVVFEKGGPVRFVLYTRDQIDVTPSATDPTVADQVVISYKSWAGDKFTTTRLFWTADMFAKTVDDTLVKDEAYPDGAHPYGRIPLVAFRNDEPDENFFGGEPATDLVLANLGLNRMATDLNWKMLFQGSSVMVTNLGDDNKIMEIGVDARVNFADEKGDLRFVAPDPLVEQTVAAINVNLRLFMMSRGIPEDAFTVTPQGSSGIAIVARAASMLEWRKTRAEQFRESEQELIQLALEVQEIHSGRKFTNIPFPQIAYTIPKEPMAQERRFELDWKIKHNAATPKDILLAEDPMLDDKAAGERIRANAEYNASVGEAPMPGFDQGGNQDQDGANA